MDLLGFPKVFVGLGMDLFGFLTFYMFCDFSVHFFLDSYLKMMKNALWAPFLLECSFLITFLFKNDEKCDLISIPPPVSISSYILIKK